MAEKKLALFLFCLTGNMARPWKEAGYETLSVDNAHGIRKPDLDTGMWCDLRTVGPLLMKLSERGYGIDDIAFMAAFPPCTDTAVCQARDMPTKGLRALAQATEFFATCQEIASLISAPWMIENPVTAMSSYWRKPDCYFEPWHYTLMEPQDNYTKKTSIWHGNGFVMPAPCPDDLLGKPDDRIHKASPDRDRGNVRSATPMGFARAVFAANALPPTQKTAPEDGQ